jgi:hypothetical protein
MQSQAVKDIYFSPGMGIGDCIPSKGFSFEINLDFGLIKT